MQALPLDLTAFYNANRGRSLRQQVKAPGLTKKRQFLHYADGLLIGHCNQLEARKVLDLGCGRGETLNYLADVRDGQYSGISISQIEQQLGLEEVEKLNRQLTVRLFAADFDQVSTWRLFPSQDIVFSQDALVHSRAAFVIVGLVAKALRPEGRFIVCQEFLSSSELTLDAKDMLLVSQYRQALDLTGLVQLDEWLAASGQSGLQTIENQDLSAYVQNFDPLWYVYALISLCAPKNIDHSVFLRRCRALALRKTLLKRGLLQYRLLVLEKSSGQ